MTDQPSMLIPTYDGNDYTVQELKDGIAYLQAELDTRDFDLHSYIREEFRRYFPDADKIHVTTTNGGETIDVGVRMKGDGFYMLNYRMSVGSDDEWFEFTSNTSGRILTIPIPAAMSS